MGCHEGDHIEHEPVSGDRPVDHVFKDIRHLAIEFKGRRVRQGLCVDPVGVFHFV